jgi:immune inhibitor A
MDPASYLDARAAAGGPHGRDPVQEPSGGSVRRTRVAVAATASLIAAATTLSLTSPQAVATPTARTAAVHVKKTPNPSDVITPGWKEKLDQVRQSALEKRLRTGGRGQAEKVGRSFGRVAQTGTDRIFVVLAEFGNTQHSAYPSAPDAKRTVGPLHNEIPKPDRTKDNSTLWQPDYDRAHFEDLYFNRMRQYYEDQSSGRYSVDGDVTEWVKVPFNEARYGSDNCGSIICPNVYFLVRDALSVWVKDRIDAHWSMKRIQDYLKTFDKQDRYDYDGDGDFNEPDGYIDHFQIVHAGGDEADGDPEYGSDAIWSHRSNVAIHPHGEGPGPAIGGVNVGEGGPSDGGKEVLPDNPTGIWVSDYTMQPENGGLSVFAHEYGHDLGLPDEYDTSGNTGGAENSTGFWTLMSQSRGTSPGDPGIGDRPMPLGAWDKFQLGWLDYDVVHSGRRSTHELRAAQKVRGPNPNGLIVLLPDKDVTFKYGATCPGCGERFFNSGTPGNDLDRWMARGVEDGGELTAKVRYDIEEGWDYAFLEASSDGGQTWTQLPNSQSYDGPDQGSFNGSGTGISGSSDGQWVDLTATVPAGTDMIRWRYMTDGATALTGFQVDNITLDGQLIGGAETDSEGWELNGFEIVSPEVTKQFLNAYFVDNRQHLKRDRLLGHVYNFGFTNPDRVEFFRYEPGALISYWDTSHNDNNVGEHPGSGQILPVDAHPTFVHAPDGSLLRPRTLTHDSAFSLRRTARQTIHYLGQPVRLRSLRAVPTFDDRLDWWYSRDEHTVDGHPGRYQPGWYGVDVPNTGTTIRVVKVNKRTGAMTVRVGSAR